MVESGAAAEVSDAIANVSCALPGGAVAMEIAMVLESWGHTIGLVLVMDTPRSEQIRPLQPHATAADESDVMELVEMILGALGSDALGMGDSMAHPAKSEEWTSFTFAERMEFFAPIWRIMRDDNMTALQVCPAAVSPHFTLKQC